MAPQRPPVRPTPPNARFTEERQAVIDELTRDFAKKFVYLLSKNDWIGLSQLFFTFIVEMTPSNAHWRGAGDELPSDAIEGDMFLDTGDTPPVVKLCLGETNWIILDIPGR